METFHVWVKDYHDDDGDGEDGYDIDHHWEEAAVREAAERYHDDCGGEWNDPNDLQTFYARKEGQKDKSEYVVSIEYCPHFYATKQATP